MQFGVCADPCDSAWLREAGADFVEGHVQKLFAPAEESWEPAVAPEALAVPLAATNCFFPGSLKITGPDVDVEAIGAYAARACQRSAAMGSGIIVFGSGTARTVPDGWPREKAEGQLVEAMQAVGPLAVDAGVTIAMEPLQQGESNILNTVAEGLEYMRRADTPGISILCDFYHLAVEHEPLSNLDAAKGMLTHVHIAEPEGRVAPAPGGTDFRPFFRKLKQLGYDARISVECKWDDLRAQAAPTLAYLRGEWDAA